MVDENLSPWPHSKGIFTIDFPEHELASRARGLLENDPSTTLRAPADTLGVVVRDFVEGRGPSDHAKPVPSAKPAAGKAEYGAKEEGRFSHDDFPLSRRWNIRQMLNASKI